MANTDRIKELLRSPSNAHRPVQIIHSYYPRTPAEVETYLDNAERNGLGGFVVNMDASVPHTDGETDEDYRNRSLDAYLGGGTPETEASWTALKYFIDACIGRGLIVWIYDERAYPSGAAGHHVLKRVPDAQVKGLACKSVISAGHGEMVLEEKDSGFRCAAAYPVSGDGSLITEKAVILEKHGNKIVWQLDSGEWRICAFFTRPVEFLTENRVPYVDLMREDVVKCYIDVTHGEYLRRLGEETISRIKAFFTDEPGLPVHGCSSYFYEKDAICAWTEEFDTLLPGFESRYVDLFFDTDRDFAASRREWWKTAADLYSRNYFGQIGRWCEEHGTRMTGHLYGEETLSMQIGLNADLFGLQRYMQAPGVDRLYCAEPRDVTAEKTASSAAHFYGRDMVMTENSFHLEYNWWHTPDAATPRNRINSAFYQIQLGVTDISSYFAYKNEYDKDRIEFEEKSARAADFCCTGTHSTDVLVLIPMTAAYERFAVPDHKYWDVGPCTVAPYQPQSVQRLEKSYGDVLFALEEQLCDFDLADEKALCECRADNGRIIAPHESYGTLVLWNSGKYDDAAIAKLGEFLEAGVKLVIIGTDLPSEEISLLSAKYPSLISGGISELKPLLDIGSEHRNIRIRKSVTEDNELYFIHNRGAEDRVIAPADAASMSFFGSDGKEIIPKDGRITVPSKDAVFAVK